MKIAITSRGPALTSQVAPRFGRADYFIVLDSDRGEFMDYDNRLNACGAQEVGIEAAHKMIDLGIEAVITANVGPKAFTVLKESSVSVYVGPAGTVQNALDSFKAGGLLRTDKATVKGDWS